MTKTELNAFRKVLENKQAEVGNGTRDREALAINTSPEELDRIQNASDRDWAMGNLERTGAGCEKCKLPCGALTPVRLESAPAAKRTSVRSAWPRCRGLRTASSARRPRTAKAKRPGTRLTHRWCLLLEKGRYMLWTVIAISRGFLWLLRSSLPRWRESPDPPAPGGGLNRLRDHPVERPPSHLKYRPQNVRVTKFGHSE